MATQAISSSSHTTQPNACVLLLTLGYFEAEKGFRVVSIFIAYFLVTDGCRNCGWSSCVCLLEYFLEKIASPDVAEFLKGKKCFGFACHLHDLKMKFLALSAIIVDAEQKQNKVLGVKDWLDKLKDAVDDAEDLFEKIEYDALKLKVEKEKSRAMTSKVRKKLSKFINLTDSKIKNVMDKILWREADKDALMKLLMLDDVGSNQKIYDIIPILGMGGVGKTTLAQTLFNDEQVKDKFEVMAWVYVLDNSGDACNNMDLDSLQVNFSKKLMGKKFFIVLDDVWEDEYMALELLTHHLRELSEDECWELFANYASNGNTTKFNENPKLESIGKKLVRKCNGVPLAAKVLGGLQCSSWNVE
ncbi:putative disease resistance protein RGA3 [Humulus lupulus]|uniref:putative disease resistance protein RGA3 n=1 Tax=Humulus lupulus TaxID=3486 RepID=UPI002B409F64|nr:putative disease resistance protein RGA3 [Humulus lupulus]